MSTNKRIRGSSLQKIRREHFRRDPLCVMCREQGRYTLAAQLDHKVAMVNEGPDTHSNRQGLCVECHKVKTAADLGHTYRAKVTIGPDGWPLQVKSVRLNGTESQSHSMFEQNSAADRVEPGQRVGMIRVKARPVQGLTATLPNDDDCILCWLCSIALCLIYLAWCAPSW